MLQPTTEISRTNFLLHLTRTQMSTLRTDFFSVQVQPIIESKPPFWAVWRQILRKQRQHKHGLLDHTTAHFNIKSVIMGRVRIEARITANSPII